jgi:nitroimidazol reductase NimA-like FMN-containing flavoprotein (pyridoxamine 5'-phosphate oxidase superfamily)
MLIRDMPREAVDALLERARAGHIACTEGQQPYVTPFSFGYDRVHIYGFATMGRKIAALRANPLVCVAAQEAVNLREWKSVVAFGRYEELPDTAAFFNARTTAHALMSVHADWWEPGYARTVHDGAERPLETVWFRIAIASVTGHEAVPDTPAPAG